MAITAKTASEILTRQGVNATVRIYSDEEFNPLTNTTEIGEPTDFVVKAIPPYRTTQHERYKTTELVSYGRGYTGIANYNLGFDVRTGIILSINSGVWLVVGIEKIANSLGTILFVLEIERQAGYDNLFTREFAGTTNSASSITSVLTVS